MLHQGYSWNRPLNDGKVELLLETGDQLGVRAIQGHQVRGGQ